MKKICCEPFSPDFGLLVLRLSVGLIFVYTGFVKLMDLGEFTSQLEAMDFPIPLVLAGAVGFVEFFGGLAVLVGVYIRIAAKLLAFVMVIAILSTHLENIVSGQPQSAFLAISLLGSTIALKCFGGGKWQLTKSECCCGMTKK